MPSWYIHDKWAQRMGIPKEVSEYVNGLIDFPQKCQEFLVFCEEDPDARVYSKGRPTRVNVGQFVVHDSGRREAFARELQLKFLSQKGNDYVTAWYLHHVLDYMQWWATASADETIYSIEEIFNDRRLEKQFGTSSDPELRDILHSVANQYEEISQDLRERGQPK
ncbi:hypothetical protein ES703_03218 [subsurface metagenome]